MVDDHEVDVVKRQDEVLASAVDVLHAVPDDRRFHIARVDVARQSWIEHLDLCDHAPRQERLQPAAHRFDLRQLRHVTGGAR